ncbi:outer membrane beta-barrel protein [Petrachloros mirabilis]
MSPVTCRIWQLRSLLLASFLFLGGWSAQAQAEEWKTENVGIEPGKIVLGMRAGFAPVTQSIAAISSADVGSLLNFQAMYSLNQWLLVGLILEWERHGMSVQTSNAYVDLGHQDTVSVLPTIEVRPVRYGSLTPYVNMSFGVNVNSFGENSSIRISPSNTFAWRLGWGVDYMLTEKLALNAEMAYKRNDGHAIINETQWNNWNASSFGFLFGAKMFF